MVELAENLIRNDLTPAQRKEQAMRYLSLIGAKSTTGSKSTSGTNKKSGESGWFSQWHDACGIPKASATRLWQQFADATGLFSALDNYS